MATIWKPATQYKRVKTIEVSIGQWTIGGDNPVGVQSMTNTNTLDVGATLRQTEAIIEAGGEAVRCTTQGTREAEAMGQLREALNAKYPQIPLVADVHYNPNAAFTAARLIEKVRINPGNFIPSKQLEKAANEQEELDFIRTRLNELIAICKDYDTTLRIGVNHGSLSERMMNRYGNTPEGMVASAMEYLHLCVEADFFQVVVSMKSSNPKIMVQANRMLVQAMQQENLAFPLHLGVTEAGEGEDGRIKSAVGIGALLADGMGDTIRVSLTEDPAREIPVAKQLVEHMATKTHSEVPDCELTCLVASHFSRHKSCKVDLLGDGQVPVVITNESAFTGKADYAGSLQKLRQPAGDDIPVAHNMDSAIKMLALNKAPVAINCFWQDLQSLQTEDLAGKKVILLLNLKTDYPVGEARYCIQRLDELGLALPVVFCREYHGTIEKVSLEAAADMGVLFLDGLGDGIWLSLPDAPDAAESLSFNILQATHDRITKTEYISCPGCGRTLYNLEATAKKIRARTQHLKGLKIGIMGCIVNGPGEMADADYGYVGAGPGKIALYKGQQCVEKNIAEDQAVEALTQLIKANGDWHDPE